MYPKHNVFFLNGPHFAYEFNFNSSLLLLGFVHILSKLLTFLLKLDFTHCFFFFFFFFFFNKNWGEEILTLNVSLC